MLSFKRTVYNDPDFLLLVNQLDEDLRNRYQEYQDIFTPLNKMDNTVKVIVAYNENQALGCGALRPMQEEHTIELKRMFVHPSSRGRGISKELLKELENWAIEQGNTSILLETGIRQPEAIALYQQSGYTVTEAFGDYRHIEASMCMKKEVDPRKSPVSR
ncbi:MAG: GNAT family N-acetyltransferase [Bacteroidota bacterium]